MTAQRFPNDYDGIVAGAPASNWSPLMSLSIVIQKNLGAGGLAADKLGNLPTDGNRKRRDGSPAFKTPRPALVRDRAISAA